MYFNLLLLFITIVCFEITFELVKLFFGFISMAYDDIKSIIEKR